MNNQNQWVKINKLKRQVESRNNTKERQEVMMQIESALQLMGIEFEKQGSFKIRAFKERRTIPEIFGLDLAATGRDMSINMSYSIAIHDNKPIINVIDIWGPIP